MEFITKNASKLANQACTTMVNSTTFITKYITISASNSAQEKLTTLATAFRTPKAQMFANMVLVFIAGGFVFYPNMNSTPVLITSTGSPDGGNESDKVIAPSNRTRLNEYLDERLLSPIRVFVSRIEQSTRIGIHRTMVWSCIGLTAHICFDVLFHYNIERINDRGSNSNNRSITRSGGSEPIKKGDSFCVKILELILNELKTEEAKN